VAIPPFHPINSVISDEHRAAHNLRVLQRHDPAIRIIHDQIPYVHIRLMKPPGTAPVNPLPGNEPGDEEFWEDEVDGPEGPLFFVERYLLTTFYSIICAHVAVEMPIHSMQSLGSVCSTPRTYSRGFKYYIAMTRLSSRLIWPSLSHQAARMVSLIHGACFDIDDAL